MLLAYLSSILQLKQLEIITNPEQATAAISDILDTVDNTTGNHNEKPLKSGDLKQTTSILSSIIQIGNSKNASVNSEVYTVHTYIKIRFDLRHVYLILKVPE